MIQYLYIEILLIACIQKEAESFLGYYVLQVLLQWTIKGR